MYKDEKKLHIKNGDNMRIKEEMTKNMVVANPTTTIEEASNMMKNYDIGFLPIEEDHDFIGVLTDRDIVVRAIANGKKGNEKIEPYITNYIISITSDSSLEDALQIMASERIKRLMIEENNKIIGMVSLSDILNKQNDDKFLEYVIAIFEPIDSVVITNEIDIPQSEIDEFEL